MAVKKRGDEIIFLRRVVPGGADDSFGVEVAKMAGLPGAVITRAKEILSALEEGNSVPGPKTRRKMPEEPAQLNFGALAPDSLRDRLKQIDLDALTPRDALTVLYELREML